MDIIQCIQEKVDKIFDEIYSINECQPAFTISLLFEGAGDNKHDMEHKIVLTVEHNDFAFSKVIFPNVKNTYGYESLEEEMRYLYNRTM
ncbi:hypothetical protein F4V43_02110 [Paenibacillus spiritus]|uniref:Uncharacterized protein n=1 Tax=Paenibacillus spiritus TaxID=2496557 RepID=A0A5J5GHV7_9BACL|nr:hypothetical protein [Paenibacillus spiritus]KAA9007303.1 hypothetical protein F4V43_02110 [Paenibacillus spiritus]